MAAISRSAPQTRGLSPLRRREINWGLLFLSPWIIGFIAFTALPMIASLVMSFTNYNPIQPGATRFLGLDNYQRLVTDPQLLNAIGVTLRFALISVPLSILLPLGLALLVNSERLFGKNVFRTLFYMPYMIPVVAGVMVWGGILNSESGWLNRLIEALFGIQGPRWYQDENWVLPALSIMGFWGVGNTMLTLLAGLQNVPTELYEAAKVDGAGPVTSFFNITVPMISPVVFYNLVLAIIGAFQYFTQAYIISNGRGDPNGATMFYSLYLYKTAFGFLDMGYGATLAWIMFVVVLILTIVLFQTQNRWVYYGGGND
ncbi:MAG: sugar ABC transporter permease [Anaerolineales bacterium]|nr:sugar ABC transporter permease [Anaerolineales bacterium]